MGEDFEPSAAVAARAESPGHMRILAIMAAAAVLGSVFAAIFVSVIDGLGFLTGSVLAFVNYFWMKRALGRVFRVTAEGGRPRFLGAGYFLRYLVLGLLIAAIYVGGVLPIVPLLLGMALFGFAVMVEGIVSIFAGNYKNREI